MLNFIDMAVIALVNGFMLMLFVLVYHSYQRETILEFKKELDSKSVDFTKQLAEAEILLKQMKNSAQTLKSTFSSTLSNVQDKIMGMMPQSAGVDWKSAVEIGKEVVDFIKKQQQQQLPAPAPVVTLEELEAEEQRAKKYLEEVAEAKKQIQQQ